MLNLFLKLEEYLEYLFGYSFVIHFEDCILFLAGIFVGAMIIIVSGGDIISKIKAVKQKSLDRLKIISIKKGKKTGYILNADSVLECIETFLILIFKPICTIKRYTLKDEKRTKHLITVFFIVGILLLILAYISISTVYEPHYR